MRHRVGLILIAVLGLVLVLSIFDGQVPVEAQTSPAHSPARSAPSIPAATAAYYPGGPAYDSGWFAIGLGVGKTLIHNLGGNVDQYVIDLRFSTGDDGSPDYGYNQAMYGGNEIVAPAPTGYHEGDNVGATWSDLDATKILVHRWSQDKSVPFVRVRIWVASPADWDSGWLSIAPGTTITPSFSIAGGISDNYLVYAEFKGSNGLVHQRLYGGATLNPGSHQVGAYWHSLTDSSIKVYRRPDDLDVSYVRVRIFNRPKATYDSGWSNIQPGTTIIRQHNIGGNPDDYIVDVQFKDTTAGPSSSGVNHRCFGSCDIPSSGILPNMKRGAYWDHLGKSSIHVYRAADDVYADQVRVRIWNIWTPPRPDYDSSWKTVGAGETATFYHHLGGNEDDYLVNMVFMDVYFHGINQMYYGSKQFGTQPPPGYSASDFAGAYWWGLSNSAINASRRGSDKTVDRMRLKIWRMPLPDFDSGWTPVSKGLGTTLSHGLTGIPSDFLVDLSFQGGGGRGKNHVYFGGSSDVGGTYLGAYWHNFDTRPGHTQVTVYRQPDEESNDLARVRIWRISRPAGGAFQFALAPGNTYTYFHNLHLDLGNALVDVTAVNGTAHHKAYFGRLDMMNPPLPGYAAGARVGFYWSDLLSDSIKVRRMEEDDVALSFNVRIWKLPHVLYLPVIQR